MTAGRNGTRSTTKTLLTVMSTSLVLAIGVAGCGTTEQGPLKSAKAQFSAKQGMEISSSANLSVSAQTELTQKAMMVDIKANAKGTLSAGAMLEVKGGLVKIN